MADWVNPAPYPIIYVRGYAMTRGEIDATTGIRFAAYGDASTAATIRRLPPRPDDVTPSVAGHLRFVVSKWNSD